MTSPRSELVTLLRGFFACPVLAALADLGLTRRMRAGPFTTSDLAGASNRQTLLAALRYLKALALIEPAGEDTFRATAVGEYILDRVGAFHLLRSYRDYFDHFAELLSDPSAASAVHRLENVCGTGQLHARKYFPAALRRLAGKDIRCIVDIGCGNGEFLAATLADHPSATAVGVDLSAEAVAATVERFRGTACDGRLHGVVAHAAAVSEWARLIPHGGTGAVVAIWLVLHEFAGSDPSPVVRFFHDLHAYCPFAEVIVGEIVALSPESLAPARAESIMPELLLFHALSEQGVLSWEQHSDWLARVPYQLTHEDRYDELPGSVGCVPCSFVWHLAPKNPRQGQEEHAASAISLPGQSSPLWSRGDA